MTLPLPGLTSQEVTAVIDGGGVVSLVSVIKVLLLLWKLSWDTRII